MIRTYWNFGNINYYTLFETLPFENLIESVEMNGKELKLCFKIL